MGNISANSLKTQGAKAITRALAKSPEATVSVRGKDRSVVMRTQRYQVPSRVRADRGTGRKPDGCRCWPLRQGIGGSPPEAAGKAVTSVLVFIDQHNRRSARFLKQHPQAREQHRKTLLLLQANPQHPSFRLPALRGKLAGLRSALINLSYRITPEMIVREHEIVPIDVGDRIEPRTQ